MGYSDPRSLFFLSPLSHFPCPFSTPSVSIFSIALQDGNGFELIPSADGMTCGVKSVSKGSATITARVIDKNGNAVKNANGNEITASQQLTSKAGFFQKLVAFFKKLFGSNMIIPYALNKLIK